jgi:hypothetical protein
MAPVNSGSCLSCMHFDRMFRGCKYDQPRGAKKAKRTPAGPPRISAQTDLYSFRCGDYLAWETGLLPFTTPASQPDANGTDAAGR